MSSYQSYLVMLMINDFFPRSEDEIDQVAHGRWGKNEESDVSDAPITDNSDSESDSRSESRSALATKNFSVSRDRRAEAHFQ